MKTKLLFIIFILVSLVLLSACKSKTVSKSEIAETPAVEKSSLINLEKNEYYVAPDSDSAVFVDKAIYRQFLRGNVTAVDESTITLSREDKQLIIKKDPKIKYFSEVDTKTKPSLVDADYLKVGDYIRINVVIDFNTGETVDLMVSIT
jgi:ABC-type Fe3+-citrate transport system substrate-binding protein